MKKIYKLMFVALLCVMAGCSGSSSDEDTKISTNPISSDGYRIAMPFSSGDTTQIHVQYNRGSYDLEAIGKGLQRYSKEHFATDTYYLQDGQLLTYNDLVATSDNPEALLGRKSNDNPFGLNPENGTTIPVDATTDVTVGSATITVSDVVEYDFYRDLSADAEIQGVSYAIVLNQEVTDADGNTHTIADAQLQIIGEEAARNLMTYTKDLPEINANTPIMIALFKATSSDANLAGTFFAKGYGTTGIDRFDSLNEEWAIVPSDSATNLDPQVVSQFSELKDSLFGFLPNDIAVIGKAFFINDNLEELEITITTQGKTQIQNEAIVQYTREQINSLFSSGYRISVNVETNTQTYAMLQRENDSDDITVVMK